MGSDSSLQIEEEDLDDFLDDEGDLRLPEELPPSSAPTGTPLAEPSQGSSGTSPLRFTENQLKKIITPQLLEAPKNPRKRNSELLDANAERRTIMPKTISISLSTTS